MSVMGEGEQLLHVAPPGVGAQPADRRQAGDDGRGAAAAGAEGDELAGVGALSACVRHAAPQTKAERARHKVRGQFAAGRSIRIQIGVARYPAPPGSLAAPGAVRYLLDPVLRRPVVPGRTVLPGTLLADVEITIDIVFPLRPLVIERPGFKV